MEATSWLVNYKMEFEMRKIVKYALIGLCFPLSVISTNRILNTAISRGGTANSFRPISLWHDFWALKKIGGYKTLFAGFWTTLIVYMFTRRNI